MSPASVARLMAREGSEYVDVQAEPGKVTMILADGWTRTLTYTRRDGVTRIRYARTYAQRVVGDVTDL